VAAIVGITKSGLVIVASGTNSTPSLNAVAHPAATSIASRVLPVPPRPASVNSRQERSSSTSFIRSHRSGAKSNDVYTPAAERFRALDTAVMPSLVS
jgi:hypothetical protein